MPGLLLSLSLFATSSPVLECTVLECLEEKSAAAVALRMMSAATVLESEGHTDLALGLYGRLSRKSGHPYQNLAKQAIARIEQASVARSALFSSMTTTAVLTGGLTMSGLLKFGGERIRGEAYVLTATASAIAGAYGGLLLARRFEPALGAVELGASSAVFGFLSTLNLLNAHAEGDDMPAAILLSTTVATAFAVGGATLGQRFHVHDSGVRLAGTLAVAAAIEASLLLAAFDVEDPLFIDLVILAAAGGGALGLYASRGRALPSGRYLTLWVGGLTGFLVAGTGLVIFEPSSDEVVFSLLATGIGAGMVTAWITGRQDVGEPYPPRNTSKISFGPPMVLPDRRGGIAVAAPSLHVRF
jgi:hypothetical protein